MYSLPGDKQPVTSAPDGVFRPTVGSWVQIDLDQDVFELLQQGHGGWNHSMIAVSIITVSFFIYIISS